MAEHKTSAAASPGQLLQQPLRCVVVTPEATVLDHPAEFVALPLYDGEVGIGRGHSPMIGRLGYGELRLKDSSGQSVRYYVGGGFVQVAANVVSVLTQQAIPADKIDTGAAASQLREAHHRRADSEASLEERERLESQARAQLRMARGR